MSSLASITRSDPPKQDFLNWLQDDHSIRTFNSIASLFKLLLLGVHDQCGGWSTGPYLVASSTEVVLQEWLKGYSSYYGSQNIMGILKTKWSDDTQPL